MMVIHREPFEVLRLIARTCFLRPEICLFWMLRLLMSNCDAGVSVGSAYACEFVVSGPVRMSGHSLRSSIPGLCFVALNVFSFFHRCYHVGVSVALKKCFI